MSSVIYWIHHPEHTDMFSQGYVGVSKDLKKRWNDHAKRTGNLHLKRAIKKYGWDNLIKEIVLVAEETYCLMIEAKLRAENKIGWNIVKGGGMPPIFTKTGWKHTDEANEKNRQAHLGKSLSEEHRKKVSEGLKKITTSTRFVKGQIAWNKGIQMSKENTQHLHIELICPHCNKKGMLGGMTRWHMDQCKNKGVSN